MRYFFLLLLFLPGAIQVIGQTLVQQDTLEAPAHLMEELIVYSTRVGEDSPVPHSNLKTSDIAQENLGRDVPYLLRWTPSLVETSDAGNGVGYTGIRIRGTDPTRINITLNGIPLNDAESQAVYWVNLPDFSSSVSNIQVQRGAGTSTNGAGAFGATVNLNTQLLRQDPYVTISGSYGSYNTLKNSIALGTGLLNKHFAFDGRLSRISSDGYIDRASSDLRSWYLSGVFMDNHQSLRCLVFSGKEKTYQAWYGVPAQYVGDETLRTFNIAGTEKVGTPYDNETDNYTQTHYQLIYNTVVGPVTGNLSLHYTRGAGYYEQYKGGQFLADYGLPDISTGDSIIQNSDLIRQLWLDNDFLGAIFSLRYAKRRSEIIVGGGWNRYWGAHFGTIPWMQYAGSTTPGYSWYNNDALKTDFNTYLKWNYVLADNLKAFLDLQLRQVGYRFLGYERDGSQVNQTVNLPFFNPKAGLNLYLGPYQKDRIYAFAGIARREPNRDDYVDSSPDSRPRPEHLYDFEAGYEVNGKQFSGAVNGYYMHYKDQLVLTGRINDVGAATRVNVPESYRLGVELVGALQMTKKWRINGNATFSRNKIKVFESYKDNWDTGMQEVQVFQQTDLAFSPSVTGAAQISFHALEQQNHDLNMTLGTKYVGKQYIDNTGEAAALLKRYFYTDFLLAYTWHPKGVEAIQWTFQVNNIFNARYSSNAWIYRFVSEGYDPVPDDPYAQKESGGNYNLMGYFPQAGRNFMLGMVVKI